MRIKIVKKHKYYAIGQVVVLDQQTATVLIEKGIAVVSKDMAPDDYKQAGDNNGKFTELRSHISK